MEVMAIVKLIPVVLSVVEVFKRFIPDRQRGVVNPIAAAIVGLVGAYATGGTQGLVETLLQGLIAAGGAIAVYKVPKAIGAGLDVG